MKETPLYRLYTSLCGASNSLGRHREAIVFDLIEKSGKYKTVKREAKAEINLGDRKHHSVDLWLENEDTITLANLKSAGHSNTDPDQIMIDTYTRATDAIQKQYPNKKVNYIVLRYNKAKHAKTQKRLVELLSSHGIESYDLEEFFQFDVTEASNKKYEELADERLLKNLTKEEREALGRKLLGL